jgi:hypothetical protein
MTLTFAQLAVHQSGSSCQCLCGVLKLAERLELDNLKNKGSRQHRFQHQRTRKHNTQTRTF